jgi:NAD-dependent deacetylase
MDIIGKNIVVFTGAGISADSGIPTFRDSNGLWHEYNVKDVATYEAWKRDKETVLEFYNQRRKAMLNVEPNEAHFAIAELERYSNVNIITQNIDNLHEKAGSTKILHLHGEIFKSRSTVDKNIIYDCEGDINLGDKCSKGSQLRPHVVWFGESVSEITRASAIVKNADLMIVVGSSLVVEPAASLVRLAYWKPVYLVDPNPELSNFLKSDTFYFMNEKADVGVPKLVNNLLYSNN